MRHRAINTLWALTARPAAHRLHGALRDPHRAQGARLDAIVRANADTTFGRRHGLDAVTSVARFRQRVPLSTHADYAELLEAVRRGESRVLTAERVERLVPTSGSSGPVKLVPYTRTLRREMNEALGAWIVDLLRAHPTLGQGPAYWSVSPAVDLPEQRSAVPVGFDDDSRYLGRVLGRMVERTLVAPPALREMRPLASFQYATLLCLLGEPDLRLVSVWHPSFLTVLLDARGELWDRLVNDIAHGTFHPPIAVERSLAARFTARRHRDPARAQTLARLGADAPVRAVWPALRLVSAWADAAAAPAFADLASRLPGIALQPKGLLSTEAFVSIPYAGQHPLAVTAHFYEFLADGGRALTASQVELGGRYEVVVTTGGGLYRYRTGDQVQVDGFVGRTPSLRFVGRVDQVVDLTGEKLDEAWVGSLLEQLRPASGGGFTMLAPDRDGARYGYTLYTDITPASASPLAGALEERLRENPGFAYARDLGQLAPVRVFHVAEPAHAAYVRRLAARGAALGGIKPARLSALDGWSGHFRGAYLSTRPQTRHHA